MECRQEIINRLLWHKEDLALFLRFFTLLLAETGCIAWLERLPAPPAPLEPESPFLALPPWYKRPRVEVTLLLAVASGMLAWTALGLIALFQCKRRSAETVHAHRSAMAGADLVFVQFFRP